MGGSEGRSASRVKDLGRTREQQILENQSRAGADGGLASLMADFGSGKVDLQTAIKQAQSQGANFGEGGAKAAMDSLATGTTTGQRFASEQVMSDPVLGKMFGKGGLQDQVMGKEGQLGANLDESREALAGKGDSYGLTDSDLKAYGQGSGNIARMFGQSEQSLSSALADRGLGAAPSGTAGAQFSGLQGNKMEQLAGLQTQIAQNRIQTAQNLAKFRMDSDMQRAQMAGQLGTQGAQATANVRSQNMGGQAEAYKQMQGVNASGMEGQAMAQNQNNEEYAQKEATRQASLGEAMVTGFTQGMGGLAKALPGEAVQFFSGGALKTGRQEPSGGAGGAAPARGMKA